MTGITKGTKKTETKTKTKTKAKQAAKPKMATTKPTRVASKAAPPRRKRPAFSKGSLGKRARVATAGAFAGADFGDYENPDDDADIEEDPRPARKATLDEGPLDIVRLYLKDIGARPLLTSEEEKELAYRVKDGDADAKKEMATANLRLVVSIAKKTCWPGT